jgi:hypothetical protein
MTAMGALSPLRGATFRRYRRSMVADALVAERRPA